MIPRELWERCKGHPAFALPERSTEKGWNIHEILLREDLRMALENFVQKYGKYKRLSSGSLSHNPSSHFFLARKVKQWWVSYAVSILINHQVCCAMFPHKVAGICMDPTEEKGWPFSATLFLDLLFPHVPNKAQNSNQGSIRHILFLTGSRQPTWMGCFWSLFFR